MSFNTPGFHTGLFFLVGLGVKGVGGGGGGGGGRGGRELQLYKKETMFCVFVKKKKSGKFLRTYVSIAKVGYLSNRISSRME